MQTEYAQAFRTRSEAAYSFAAATRNGTPELGAALANLRQAQAGFNNTRDRALRHVEKLNGSTRFDDTNYIFLSFVTSYLPVGVVGLVIGVIFSASMGSTSGEINSLATVSVIDIYRRYVFRRGGELHYVIASRVLTVFWGAYAVGFGAIGARGFGALIERVNIVGSLFYGGLLGVFVLAFFFKHVQGTAAFWGVLAGEAAIIAVALATQLSFLWYNVVGCAAVVLVAMLITKLAPKRPRYAETPSIPAS
ncbi:MAG: hypothetical protein JOZ62_20295 [Acidobacteriaceae bacterium]|nr:hypothetical protein [Acidobacteriaceae bacterium]